MSSGRDVGVSAALFGVVLVAHALGADSANPWVRSAVLRFYYIPILFAAYSGGLLFGTSIGILSAIAHYSIMQWSSNGVQADLGLLPDHASELIFFVVVGGLVGAFRDHERYERRRNSELSALFGSYVSPLVLHQIVERQVPLDGTAVQASVLFSDLRGFTSMAEGMEPKEVLALLNTYFGAMTTRLLAHGAFIDKFMGDGLMAVFGVPIEQPDSALRAVNAAIEMHHTTMAMNNADVFGDRRLDTAVGIHMGAVVAGNLGSRDRQEYTVIGDAVNAAARLESLNRVYGSHVLVSETVHRAVRDDPGLLMREVDAVRLKGRVRPMVLYEVYNCCTETEIEKKTGTLSEFTFGMQMYRACEWDLAQSSFEAVRAQYPEDPISKMYCERIAYLRAECPSDWDGVFAFTTK